MKISKTISITSLTLLLVSGAMLSANAQLVRVKGKKFVEAYSNYNLNGFNAGSSFGYFFSGNLRVNSGLLYERLNFDYTSVNRFSFKAEGFYKVYQYSDYLFVEAKATVFTGLEFAKNPILGKYNQFYIGESVGLRTEYMFLSNLSVFLDAEQRFFQLSEITSKSWSLGLGLSYHF